MTTLSLLANVIATFCALYLGPCWFHPAAVQSFGPTPTVRAVSGVATAVLTALLVAAIWTVGR